jgi:hypothetical protein
MIAELEEEDYTDVVSTCIQNVQTGVHLQRYDLRMEFLHSMCQDKTTFPTLIEMMARKYFSLYKRRWVERYFTGINSFHEHIMKHAIEEQCIVLSIAYTVYDIMTEKVKEYKLKDKLIDESVTWPPSDDSTYSTFAESNVSLYRYGGFALHSLLKKLLKSNVEQPNQQNMINILKKLKITEMQKKVSFLKESHC